MSIYQAIQWTNTQWTGVRQGKIPRSGGGEVTVFDVRARFPDEKQWTTNIAKDGFAVHHDAVAYTGTTVDAALARIKVIYDFHRNVNGMRQPGASSWNGVGYMSLGDPQGNIYLVGDLNQHRAHVSGTAPNGVLWNHRLWGHCFLGSFMGFRPTQVSITAMDSLFSWLTREHTKREMTLRPHKFYQTKECPGTWAAVSSWADVTYKPTATTIPVPPQTPTNQELEDLQRELNWWLDTRVRVVAALKATQEAIDGVDGAIKHLEERIAQRKG